MSEISDDTYERLQRILEQQNGKSYTLEEAKEIGDGVIDFFNLLIELDNESDCRYGYGVSRAAAQHANTLSGELMG